MSLKKWIQAVGVGFALSLVPTEILAYNGNYPSSGDFHWKAPVVSAAALPAVGNYPADARTTLDTFTVYIWNGSSWNAIGGGGGGGTVTSVALALPASVFGVSGSPVTTSGTLTGSFNTQAANQVFAGPVGAGPSTPAFRSLVAADIPNLSAAKITSGQGSISAGSSAITVGSGANSTLGPNVSINCAVSSGSQAGCLSSTDWTSFNGKASSPLTTKGDLWGFSTVNARIPIGTDTYVLTADSTQALGLKWAVPATSGINQLTGDGTAGPGSGSQPLALTYWLTPALGASSTPPGSPTNGDRWVVLTSATGAWSGHDSSLATFASGSPSSGPVTWTNFNNTSASGGMLTFNTGSFSNNSATTTQSLSNSGDNINFTVNNTAMNIIVGLTHVPFSSGNGPSQTDFIMNFSSGGPIFKANNDIVYVQISPSWTLGDTFKIQINSGSVAYYQNNVLLSTDSMTPTFPLYGVGTASISGSASVTVNYSVSGAGSWSFVTPPEGSTIDAEANGVYRYHSGAWIALQDAGANIITSSLTLGGVTITNVPSAFLGLSTGSLTSIVANEIIGSGKAPRAMTIENIVASAAGFTCISNPVLTLYDCGTSAGACTSGTAIGSVTLTAANTQTDGTVSSPSLAAGHYWAWEVASGTCTALNATGTAEAKMQ